MYKIIEKIDDNTTRELKLSVFYDKGGYNCWTGREKERGIKLSVSNVIVTGHGAYGIERYDPRAEGNFKMHLETLARKSAKKLDYWQKKVEEKSDELLEAWCAKMYSKFFTILGV